MAVLPERVLDIAFVEERDPLRFFAAPDMSPGGVHVAAPRFVAVGQQVPLDGELARGLEQRFDAALGEADRADAFERQVVAHHVGHLREDPELRFTFHQQPHPREHRHPAMHSEVIADAPQVLARQGPRP